jgi:hypothetical protein
MSWTNDLRVSGVPPKLACATVMRAEPEIKADPKALPGLQQQFCLTAAPVIWSNHWRHDDDSNQPQAADWARVKQGGDVCIPLTWTKESRLLAYSQSGYTNKTWTLPDDWRSVKTAKLIRIASDGSGITPHGTVEIKEGKITLSLQAAECVIITS